MQAHTTANEAGTPLLAARDIVKRFGAVVANDGVSLEVQAGEIHALLGENGAGKSTLVKILYGALAPDSGTLEWQGAPLHLANPAQARARGIGMVFQHFSLFEALTVAENIALAVPGAAADAALAARIREVSAGYGLPLNPQALVADLSVGERQRIEIVRCLLQQPRVIILDEPTAVLTPQEAENLFVTLRRLAGEGCAVLYISHRLQEVQALCHRATILRHGRVVADVDPRQETAASLARLMIGSDVAVARARSVQPGEVLFEARGLDLPAEGPFAVALDDVSFKVRAGEVLAVAGVAGNGQGELFAALSGETLSPAGSVFIAGQDVSGCGIDERRRRGAAFVPEERLGHAAVPALTLSGNAVLSRHGTGDGLLAGPFVDAAAARAVAARVVRVWDVRVPHDDPEASALSGGNLQKFVIGRELDRTPAVLCVDQPTWGVDAGAASQIRQALVELAAAGSAVLVISQDLDEVFEIATSIAVISRGRLCPAVPAGEMSEERIGLLMAGAGELAGAA